MISIRTNALISEGNEVFLKTYFQTYSQSDFSVTPLLLPCSTLNSSCPTIFIGAYLNRTRDHIVNTSSQCSICPENKKQTLPQRVIQYRKAILLARPTFRGHLRENCRQLLPVPPGTDYRCANTVITSGTGSSEHQIQTNVDRNTFAHHTQLSSSYPDRQTNTKIKRNSREGQKKKKLPPPLSTPPTLNLAQRQGCSVV